MVENLKTALLKLQQKLEEARLKAHSLIADHRRTRAAEKALRQSLEIRRNDMALNSLGALKAYQGNDSEAIAYL